MWRRLTPPAARRKPGPTAQAGWASAGERTGSAMIPRPNTTDGEVYATAESYEAGRDFARRHALARFGAVAVVPFTPAE